MTIFQAIFLGIVQGVTEFLPISSSAHLLFIPKLLNWPSIPSSYEVALHFGTLIAIVVIFFKDWIELLVSGLKISIKKEKDKMNPDEKQKGRIFWYLVFSTIIVAIIAFLIDGPREVLKESKYIPYVMAASLIGMGIALYYFDKNRRSDKTIDKLSFKDALIIGVSQIIALIPGMSRSGTTITTSRILGLNRKDAAKYSFYLATPVIFAATIAKFKEFEFTPPFILGTLASFIIGVLVIKVLLKFLETEDYKVFAIYRVIIGIMLIVLAAFKIIV